jgi:mercuric ion transport protein
MEPTSRKRWVWIGGIGAGLAALCCFTPVLVALLGALGLAAVTGYLDYVLLPVLLVSLGLLAYGLAGSRAGASHQCCAADAQLPAGADKAREVKRG